MSTSSHCTINRRFFALTIAGMLVAHTAAAQVTATQLITQTSRHIVESYYGLGTTGVVRFFGTVTVHFAPNCSAATRESTTQLISILNTLIVPGGTTLVLAPAYEPPCEPGTRNTILICEGPAGLAQFSRYTGPIPPNSNGLAAPSFGYGTMYSSVVWVKNSIQPGFYNLGLAMQADYNALLHELMHSLGILSESTDNRDVMCNVAVVKGYSKTEYYAIQVLYRTLRGGETKAEAIAATTAALRDIFYAMTPAQLAAYHP